MPSRWRALLPTFAVLAAYAFAIGALDLLYVVIAIDVTGGPPTMRTLRQMFMRPIPASATRPVPRQRDRWTGRVEGRSLRAARGF